jgi:hypothetical protein
MKREISPKFFSKGSKVIRGINSIGSANAPLAGPSDFSTQVDGLGQLKNLPSIDRIKLSPQATYQVFQKIMARSIKSDMSAKDASELLGDAKKFIEQIDSNIPTFDVYMSDIKSVIEKLNSVVAGKTSVDSLVARLWKARTDLVREVSRAG